MNRTPVRQTRLKEVGLIGQNRLHSARVLLHASDDDSTSFERWVAEQYLDRSGVGQVDGTVGPDCVNGQSPEHMHFDHTESFRHGAAHELASGAWRALRLIRKILT